MKQALEHDFLNWQKRNPPYPETAQNEVMRQWLRQYRRLEVLDEDNRHWLLDRASQFPICQQTAQWIQQERAAQLAAQSQSMTA